MSNQATKNLSRKTLYHKIFMRLFENVIMLDDVIEIHRNTSPARGMLNILCQYRQAQFPPPLIWMNRD